MLPHLFHIIILPTKSLHASSAWGLAAVSVHDWLLQGALEYGVD